MATKRPEDDEPTPAPDEDEVKKMEDPEVPPPTDDDAPEDAGA